MIASCPSCGTQFNIPDDKVTEKGLPTRCASCKTVFRVYPEGTTPPEAKKPEQQEQTQPEETQLEAEEPSAEVEEAPEEEPEKTAEVEETPEEEPEPPAEVEEAPEEKPEPSAEVEEAPEEKPEPPAEKEAPEDKPETPEEPEPAPREEKPEPPKLPTVQKRIATKPSPAIDDLDISDLKPWNRTSVKVFSAFVAIGLLLGLIFYIQWVTKDIDTIVETMQDRDIYAEGEQIKRSFSPDRLLGQGIVIWHKGGMNGAFAAVQLFEQVLTLDKENPEAKARLAEIAILSGFDTDSAKEKADQACETAERMIQAPETSPTIQRLDATCLYYKKSYNKAIASVEKSIAQSPTDLAEDSEGYLLAGKIYLAKKDKKKAKENLTASIEKSDDMFEAHHLLAALYADEMDYEKAVTTEQAALAINPSDKEAKTKLEEYKQKLKDFKEGGTYDGHMELAKKFRKAGNYNQSISHLNKALELKPGSTTALMMKGRMLIDSQPSAALDAFSKAAQYGSIEAYYYKGSIQQSQGNFAGAIVSYESYLLNAPGGAHSYEVKSILKSLKGQ